jgi:hypothetical protein
MDMIIRIVKIGEKTVYLPIVEGVCGEEIMRGEYKDTPEEALERCKIRVDRIENEGY